MDDDFLHVNIDITCQGNTSTFDGLWRLEIPGYSRHFGIGSTKVVKKNEPNACLPPCCRSVLTTKCTTFGKTLTRKWATFVTISVRRNLPENALHDHFTTPQASGASSCMVPLQGRCLNDSWVFCCTLCSGGCKQQPAAKLEGNVPPLTISRHMLKKKGR